MMLLGGEITPFRPDLIAVQVFEFVLVIANILHSEFPICY